MEILIKVEDLARSLFREFLIKNSLNKTLEIFNEEDKRYRPKITKIDLIKYLAIEKLIKTNKEKETPCNTLLEIIVDYLHSKFRQRIDNIEKTSKISSQKHIVEQEKALNLKENSKLIKTNSYDIPFNKKEKKQEKTNKISENDSLDLPDNSQNKPKILKKLTKEYKPNENLEKNKEIIEKPKEKIEKLENIDNFTDKTFFKKNSKTMEKPIKFQENFIEKEENFFEKTEENLSKQKILEITHIKENVSSGSLENQPKEIPKFSKTKQNMKNIEKTQEITKNEPKPITDELDEFDDVFNFGIKPTEKPIEKPKKQSFSKLQPDPLPQSEVMKKPGASLKVRIDFNKTIEIPYFVKKQDFDYLMKMKLSMKPQIKSKNLNLFDKDTREGLRKVLFGEGEVLKNLPKSWTQGFYFTENPQLFFGLFQKEGGPCGVLACVQAYLIKHLIFFAKGDKNDKNMLNLLRVNCLLISLAEILWKCATFNGFNKMKRISIVLSENNSLNIENCGIIGYDVKDINELYGIIQNHKDDFIGQFNNGVAMFLYSVILTKGLEKFISEMDLPDNYVIGLHSTCTQEIVNLLLTGEASTNCIDGTKEIDSNYKIKGIKEKSEVGFLTLLEHYGYTKVEKHLKEPFLPIWVISTEYHYCLCFSMDFNAVHDDHREFEIVYYDGLNHPMDFIVVEIMGNKEKIKGKEEPLLDMALMTKWGKDREIIWKGYGPIF